MVKGIWLGADWVAVTMDLVEQVSGFVQAVITDVHVLFLHTLRSSCMKTSIVLGRCCCSLHCWNCWNCNIWHFDQGLFHIWELKSTSASFCIVWKKCKFYSSKEIFKWCGNSNQHVWVGVFVFPLTLAVSVEIKNTACSHYCFQGDDLVKRHAE